MQACQTQVGRLTRRDSLRAAFALAAAATAPQAWSHANAGRVEPRQAAPALRLTLSEGAPREWRQLLRGRITAVQLMFTGCSVSCPIQGAQFAQLQDLLQKPPTTGASPAAWQLLSLSIDALGDDPARMRRWLARWPAGPFWLGAVALPGQVDTWLDFLGGRSTNPSDRHTAQVYLFDAQARLAWRSTELPTPAGVAQTMRELQRS